LFKNQFVRFHFLFYLFSLFKFEVLSIECFEKIRHSQKIFPLKNLKGFKCIYNELERKGSLPYLEQKRAASSSPNTRRIPPVPPPPIPPPPKQSHSPPIVSSPKIINSPPNSPKTHQKTTTEQTSITQKSQISNLTRLYQERLKSNRSSDSLVNQLTATNHSFPTVNSSSNETMVMRYQTIQRYKSNFEILKPATVIAEEWRNLDKTQKDRLAIGGPKALVLVSKSTTPNKNIQVIQT
jgi:hypothetical protein